MSGVDQCLESFLLKFSCLMWAWSKQVLIDSYWCSFKLLRRGLVYVSFWFVSSVAGLPAVCILFVLGRLSRFTKLLRSVWKAIWMLCLLYFNNDFSWRTSLIAVFMVMVVLGSVKWFLWASPLAQSPQVRVKRVSLQRTRAVSFHPPGWL